MRPKARVWEEWVAAQMPRSKVYHLSTELLVLSFGASTLCGEDLCGFPRPQYPENITFSSIREARERGLRLCKKCRARANEVYDRLLEVDDEVGPE